MKRVTAVASVFILCMLLVPAAGYADWSLAYPSGAWSNGYRVEQTTDGGFIVAGMVADATILMPNVRLFKTDAMGNKLWDKDFGLRDGYEYGYSVQQTTDGGYIIAGKAFLNDSTWVEGYTDVWLIKTDAFGNSQWDKRYEINDYDEGYSVQQTSDGGYIVTGTAGRDAFLLKTDSLGNTQWSKTYGTSGIELGYCVQITSDGGYIITGLCGSDWDYTDVLLIKTDSLGNQEWQQTFGGTGEDAAYSVRQTADGGYILTGNINTAFGTDQDLWLIKTDSLGNKQWDKIFGGPQLDFGFDVRQDSDGGYAISGATTVSGTGSDIWFIKTDPSGNKLWEVTHGLNGTDTGYGMDFTDDGGYIITGYSQPAPNQDGAACLVKIEKRTTELTAITLQSPANGVTVSSPPTFTWSANGGVDDAFAVDLSYSLWMRNYWSTYDDLKLQITQNSWTPSAALWALIPSGSTIYWRVRGVDRSKTPQKVSYSNTRWFLKR